MTEEKKSISDLYDYLYASQQRFIREDAAHGNHFKERTAIAETLKRYLAQYTEQLLEPEVVNQRLKIESLLDPRVGIISVGAADMKAEKMLFIANSVMEIEAARRLLIATYQRDADKNANDPQKARLLMALAYYQSDKPNIPPSKDNTITEKSLTKTQANQLATQDSNRIIEVLESMDEDKTRAAITQKIRDLSSKGEVLER